MTKYQSLLFAPFQVLVIFFPIILKFSSNVLYFRICFFSVDNFLEYYPYKTQETKIEFGKYSCKISYAKIINIIPVNDFLDSSMMGM